MTGSSPHSSPDSSRALILFSGGQDSATCLAWALERFESVETVGFDYGQRHAIELDCRPRLIASLRETFPRWSRRLGKDHLLDLKVLGSISDTALTSDQAIAFAEGGLPNTYVPGRNLLFLTLAAALGARRGIGDLVAGVGQVDYSGYPDCREEAIDAMEDALNIGMDSNYEIHTPLMHLDKTAIWQLADELGGEALVDIILEHSHSCYLGDRQMRHEWGYGCGTCPACALREAGYTGYMENSVMILGK
jgi:7-cyano-7-deazaguanine synthase